MARTSLFITITTYAILCRIYGTEARFDYDEESGTCAIANSIEQENFRTVGLPLSSLPGKWVSQTCETRSKSEYKHLLRSYTFRANHTFHLVQIFYKDESCSSTVYAISAVGYLYSNWNSNRKFDYYLSRVTIVLHDDNAARDISFHVNKACPNATVKFWRPYIEYEIFKSNKMANLNLRSKNGVESSHSEDRTNDYREKSRSYSDSDPNCLLFSLDINFDELFNLKMYKRPVANEFREELFLAKQCSRHHHSSSLTMSNSFQLPLYKYNTSHQNCPLCASIAASSQMFVPILHKKPNVPLSLRLKGEWISERCEPVPQERFDREESLFELFAMKNFRFDSESMLWELQIRYYLEPSCAIVIAEHESYGIYYENVQSKNVHGAAEVDFETKKSFLIVWKSTMLRRIKEDPSCGQTNYWEVGVKMELSNSCSRTRLDFLNPRNIMKIEYNEQGDEILYLGEDEEVIGRPTAFGYPLIRCDWRVVWKLWLPNSSPSTTRIWFFLPVGLVILLRT